MFKNKKTISGGKFSFEASYTESKTIRIRLIDECDAIFLLKLRTDKSYNKFLSKVSDDLIRQVEWIRQYKLDEQKNKQFYFIIERLDEVPCGTVRLYSFKSDSFTWGSWILNEDKTRYAALETAKMVYNIGFNLLGFKKCVFDVVKENKSVVNFHKRIGAKVISESSKDYNFELLPRNLNIPQWV